MIERLKILQLNTKIEESYKVENQDCYIISGKLINKNTPEHSINYLSVPK